jgi:hypothetical protein
MQDSSSGLLAEELFKGLGRIHSDEVRCVRQHQLSIPLQHFKAGHRLKQPMKES